jgi:hypothetical protein
VNYNTRIDHVNYRFNNFNPTNGIGARRACPSDDRELPGGQGGTVIQSVDMNCSWINLLRSGAESDCPHSRARQSNVPVAAERAIPGGLAVDHATIGGIAQAGNAHCPDVASFANLRKPIRIFQRIRASMRAIPFDPMKTR